MDSDLAGALDFWPDADNSIPLDFSDDHGALQIVVVGGRCSGTGSGKGRRKGMVLRVSRLVSLSKILKCREILPVMDTSETGDSIRWSRTSVLK